ncbi:MAG TPA: trehalose-phosphatase [Anaeromyxobacter sp.]
MRPFLSASGAAVVDSIARAHTLIAFDFDGTLAPIVDDRDQACMRRETRALLRATALLYPCAVISGRMRSDVAARVSDVPLIAVIGSHGAEAGFGPLDRSLQTRVASWRGELGRALWRCEGIEIEDKKFSIAVHYRHACSWRDAERRVLSAAAKLDGAVVFGGHAVVNVLPDDAPTKGDAISQLCERLGARIAVYVGDDRSDEEAFRSKVVGISIRVGGERDSSAAYWLPQQPQVDDLLRALVAARARQDGRGPRLEGLVRAMEL